MNSGNIKIRKLEKKSTSVGGTVNITSKNRPSILALDKICLELKEGDKLGIFGPNGAGKSTLMRIIGGVIKPTHGRIITEGKIRLAMSIAVGALQDLSVAENIRVQLAYAKYSPKSLKGFIDEIIDWAEIGDFRNLPVRALSPGMQARLYFAIATKLPGEIYIIDEWMGVGDELFIEKAHKRFHNMIEQSKIFILSSHNQEILSKLCNKVIEMESGKIVSYHENKNIKNDYNTAFGKKFEEDISHELQT